MMIDGVRGGGAAGGGRGTDGVATSLARQSWDLQTKLPGGYKPSNNKASTKHNEPPTLQTSLQFASEKYPLM